MLSRVQGHRLDDQRGLTATDFELPDFLKVDKNKDRSPRSRLIRTKGHERRNSDSSIMDISPENNCLLRSMSQDKIDNDRSRHTSGFATPMSQRIPYMDQSFSKDGVLPSHGDAENYFNHQPTNSPDFDDSRLMEKSLGDIGMGQNGHSAIRSTTPISKLPMRLSPHSKTPVKMAVPPRMNAPRSPRKESLDSRGSLNNTVLRVSDVDLDRTITMKTCSHNTSVLLPPPPKDIDSPEPMPDMEIANYPPPTPIMGDKGKKGATAKSMPRPVLSTSPRSSRTTTKSSYMPRLNMSINSQYSGSSQPMSEGSSNNSPRSPSSTPSPTTHDLVVDTNISPEGQGHQSRSLPPPRPPMRSPHTSLSTPPKKDVPMPVTPNKAKKTLIFEAGGSDVQVSQVSYV